MLKAQETGNDCPHKKSATLLPSFTVTPTATESTANPTTTQGPTTTSPGNSTIHPTSNSTATSPGPTTGTLNPATITSPGNATAHPTTSNGTATSPGFTSSPNPRPPPPSPSPSPSSQEAIGDYTWTNGSQPCVQLQAQIQIRVLYPTHSGGKVKLKQWGGGQGARGKFRERRKSRGNKEPQMVKPCSLVILCSVTSTGLGHLCTEPQQNQGPRGL